MAQPRTGAASVGRDFEFPDYSTVNLWSQRGNLQAWQRVDREILLRLRADIDRELERLGAPGDLDQALVMAHDLVGELARVERLDLDDDVRPLAADALDMAATVVNRLEVAISLDDEAHPEER